MLHGSIPLNKQNVGGPLVSQCYISKSKLFSEFACLQRNDVYLQGAVAGIVFAIM
jgi:hypothetical protein